MVRYRCTSKAGLPQGEDCLNLSITTPGCDDAARPVMVFFHGGAFSSGAGLSDWYDGSALSADADVVVVSVTEQLLAQPVRAFAAELDDAGARVHMYCFDWRPEGSAFGATHGVELPLLLGTRQAWRSAPMLGTTTWTDIGRLGAQLRRVWGYFARTGHIDTKSPTDLPMIWGPGRAAPR